MTLAIICGILAFLSVAALGGFEMFLAAIWMLLIVAALYGLGRAS